MEKSTPLLIEWQSALTPYFWGWNAPTIKEHIGVKTFIESHPTVNIFTDGHLRWQRLVSCRVAEMTWAKKSLCQSNSKGLGLKEPTKERLTWIPVSLPEDDTIHDFLYCKWLELGKYLVKLQRAKRLYTTHNFKNTLATLWKMIWGRGEMLDWYTTYQANKDSKLSDCSNQIFEFLTW